MIGKFALSLASLALSATVLAAQTSSAPPTVKPATQVTKAPAQTPAAKPAKPAATTAAKPATAETKAEKKAAKRRRRRTRRRPRQKKKDEQSDSEAAEEGGRAHEQARHDGLAAKPAAKPAAPARASRRRSFREAAKLAAVPHLKPRTAPLRAIGGALLLRAGGKRAATAASSPTRIDKGAGAAPPHPALSWLGRELNPRHADFQSAALPTELPSRRAGEYKGVPPLNPSRRRDGLDSRHHAPADLSRRAKIDPAQVGVHDGAVAHTCSHRRHLPIRIVPTIARHAALPLNPRPQQGAET